jgi:hypothetical protein
MRTSHRVAAGELDVHPRVVVLAEVEQGGDAVSRVGRGGGEREIGGGADPEAADPAELAGEGVEHERGAE